MAAACSEASGENLLRPHESIFRVRARQVLQGFAGRQLWVTKLSRRDRIVLLLHSSLHCPMQAFGLARREEKAPLAHQDIVLDPPIGAHDASNRVGISTEQQVANFMRHGVAENLLRRGNSEAGFAFDAVKEHPRRGGSLAGRGL